MCVHAYIDGVYGKITTKAQPRNYCCDNLQPVVLSYLTFSLFAHHTQVCQAVNILRLVERMNNLTPCESLLLSLYEIQTPYSYLHCHNVVTARCY